jgi:hypothetical protein
MLAALLVTELVLVVVIGLLLYRLFKTEERWLDFLGRLELSWADERRRLLDRIQEPLSAVGQSLAETDRQNPVRQFTINTESHEGTAAVPIDGELQAQADAAQASAFAAARRVDERLAEYDGDPS